MSEFVPFRFKVSLFASDKNELICDGAFSEVSGLEVAMEPFAVREGGRNWGELQRAGLSKFAPIVLKRGITSNDHLWIWFDAVSKGANYGYRMSGEIEVLGNPTAKVSNGQTTVTPNPLMRFKLQEVLITQFKGPDLSSTAEQVAIEEVKLVHEGMELERPVAA